MNVKRLVTIVLLFAMVCFLWVEIFLITRESGKLGSEYKGVVEQKEELEQENLLLEQDLSYYAIPDNLKKELRERLNYKEPGEHLMIVVPSQ